MYPKNIKKKAPRSRVFILVMHESVKRTRCMYILQQREQPNLQVDELSNHVPDLARVVRRPACWPRPDPCRSIRPLYRQPGSRKSLGIPLPCLEPRPVKWRGEGKKKKKHSLQSPGLPGMEPNSTPKKKKAAQHDHCIRNTLPGSPLSLLQTYPAEEKKMTNTRRRWGSQH